MADEKGHITVCPFCLSAARIPVRYGEAASARNTIFLPSAEATRVAGHPRVPRFCARQSVVVGSIFL